MFSSMSSRRRAPKRSSFKEVAAPKTVMNNFSGPRKRLLVLPFIDQQNSRRENVVVKARESVVRSLIMSGQFLVIRNSDFPQDLNQMKTQQTYNLSAIARTAKDLGIAGVVEGTILEIKAKQLSDEVGVFRKIQARVEAQVRIRVVAAKNGREILNEVRMADIRTETTQMADGQHRRKRLEDDPVLIKKVIEKAFSGTLMQITQSLDKLNWEGRIALVKGDRIYLNAGRLSGLQAGDILKVMEEGEEVFDPDTGSLIGRVPGRMKGTVEIVSYFGKDGAIGVIHSGSGFKENDRVELY